MSDLNAPNSFDSHYNGDGALRNSHDENVKAIRTTNSGLPFGATRFVGEVNGNNDYTKITYYADRIAEETRIVFTADVAGSLNDTYFTFYTARDKVKYYIWYSVDGSGTNPMLPNATGIQVNLTSGDAAMVVAMATRNALISNSVEVTTDLSGSKMDIKNLGKGETTDASAETSPFTVTVMKQGETELRAVVELEYDANCNVIGYTQDVYDNGIV